MTPDHPVPYRADPRHVVLYSGGLDSLITCRYVSRIAPGGASLKAVYFDLGHRYAAQELDALKWTWPGYLVDNRFKSLGGIERADAIIPARNAHLILGASDYLPGKYSIEESMPRKGTQGIIWLTAQLDERTTHDKTVQFFETMSDTMTALMGYPVFVVTPWSAHDKTDIVTWYLRDGGTAQELTNSWSCYSSQDESSLHVHCGNCPACIRRFIALHLNGISEEYRESPRDSLAGMTYYQRALDGRYSQKRSERILEALS